MFSSISLSGIECSDANKGGGDSSPLQQPRHDGSRPECKRFCFIHFCAFCRMSSPRVPAGPLYQASLAGQLDAALADMHIDAEARAAAPQASLASSQPEVIPQPAPAAQQPQSPREQRPDPDIRVVLPPAHEVGDPSPPAPEQPEGGV